LRGFLYGLPGIALLAYLASEIIDGTERLLLIVPAFLLFLYVYQVAIYAAYRYRLSRTRWRGIRGRLSGSAWGYGWRVGLMGIANLATLGLLSPLADRIALTYLMNNVWIGNTRGTFSGSAKNLIGIHLLSWLLFVPTIGISRFWYVAEVQKFQYNNFSVGSLRFRWTQTGPSCAIFLFVNYLIMTVTLGFGRVFVTLRNARIYAENLKIVGDIETAAAQLSQSTEELSKSGETLAEIVDVDVSFF